MAAWNFWATRWMKMWGKNAVLTKMDVVEPEVRLMADSLITEIRGAHRDWVNAQRHFEHALGKDQIDYAIFAIEAAEKRYEMLLRHAKSLKVAWSAHREADVG